MLKQKREFSEEHRKHLFESHMGIKRTPEALAKFKESMKKRWADPKFKIKMIESCRGHFVSVKTKRKLSKSHITISGEQEKQIINLYQTFTMEEIVAQLKIGRDVIYGCLRRSNIEHRHCGMRSGHIPWNKDLKLSKEQRAKLNMEGLNMGHPWNKGKIGVYSEGYVQKLRESHTGKLGPKSSNWKGGLSFELYSPEFNKQLKYEIRKRDKFICQFPKCRRKENGKAHDCHHINYIKKDSKPENLITLCFSCHMKTNGNRDYWEAYFRELVKFKVMEN